MKKPILFVVVGTALTCATFFGVFALVGFLTTGRIGLLLGSGAVAFGALGGALLLAAIRSERQNQRVNRAIASLQATRKDDQELLGALTRHADQLVARVERIHAANGSEVATTAQVETGKPAQSAAHKSSRVGNSPELLSREQSVKPGDTVTDLEYAVDKVFAPYESVRLSKSPITIDIELNNHTSAVCDFTLCTREALPNQKAAIVVAAALDANGQEIDFRCLPSQSDKYGSFRYLATNGVSSENKVVVALPSHASRLRLSLYSWAGEAELRNFVRVVLHGMDSVALAKRDPRDVKVAAILDEFSHNSFKFECDLIELPYSGWKEALDQFQPDLFVCESAWSGADSALRPWKGRVYASENFSSENRGELLKILDYCNQRGIPTVFWNKEDPAHYEDKKHNFVDTALKFDHIFTTDADCVDRYSEDYGHRSVHVLPFAVQPRLFNPVEKQIRSDDVIFAGGWYSNHAGRSEKMGQIFDSVRNSGRTLKIYDRFYESDDPSHEFPERFQSALNAAVAGDQMGDVYKESEIGITINTVTKSPTMFARRIFELMACNTYVISNYSEGVDAIFGSNVLYLDRDPNGLSKLTQQELERARQENLELVLSQHTYRKRFEKILQVSGIPHAATVEEYPIVVRVNSVEEAGEAFSILRDMGQWLGAKVLLLGSGLTNLEYADALTEYNRDGVRVVYEPLLLNGETEMFELFSGSTDALLVRLNILRRSSIDSATFVAARNHVQYSDLPVVITDFDAVGVEGARKYTFSQRQHFTAVFVQPANLAAFLRHLASGTPATVYNV